MIHLRLFLTKTTVFIGVTTGVFCFLFCFQTAALAQTADPSTDASANSVTAGVNAIQKPLGLPATDIRVVASRVVKVALGLVGIVFVILIIYGGFLYMTAGGNEEQIASAKKVLVNAAIGLALILSAYAIVVWVTNALGWAEGTSILGDNGGNGIDNTNDQNFYGSGALGTIIKDHYPARDQEGVARNTKIIITFKKPINLSSFVVNTNNSKDAQGNEIYGDCVNVGQNMKWETDCDTLKVGANLISITRADTGEAIRGASVLGSVEDGKVYTIVIRPFDALGSDTDKVQYKVHIGSGVLWDDSANNNPSIFSGRPSGFYEWLFKTDTSLDTKPPFVSNVYPDKNATESKNSVIQINFSEPMDPTDLQGSFQSDGTEYALDGHTIYLQSGKSTIPLGTMRLSNGYQTLEFVPSQECGQNACGGKVYCMPVCDKDGANCKADTYQVLIKAAQTFNVSSFEAIPFSGAMDLAGNALDGNNNGAVDVVPTSTTTIFPDQLHPDNFYWSFNLEDKIDLTAPYITQVAPGPDAENVASDASIAMVFSKRMQVESMYTIGLEQSPATAEGICHVPRVTFNNDQTTKVQLDHCPLVTADHYYYFPTVDSQVEDVKFNCFYPGKGPNTNDANTNVSEVCDDDHPDQCCPVTKDPASAFCCDGFTNQASKEACIKSLSN